MDFLAIREQSVRRLRRWKLSDPGSLPLHSDDDFEWVRDARGRRRPLPCDRGRAGARASCAGADGARRDRRVRPRALAGPRELELLRVLEGDEERAEPELQQLLVDISWREEALHALLWVLALVDDLPPDQMCPRQPVYEQLAPGPGPGQGARGPAHAAAQRDRGDARLLLLLHWHARKAQYHGDVWDYEIAPGVVLERRRALEWLFQDARWEDVDLAV